MGLWGGVSITALSTLQMELIRLFKDEDLYKTASLCSLHSINTHMHSHTPISTHSHTHSAVPLDLKNKYCKVPNRKNKRLLLFFFGNFKKMVKNNVALVPNSIKG